MLKFNSKSLITNECEDCELKQHLEKLVIQSQQIVMQKLKRQQQKQARVEAVQKEFIVWASRKESQIKQRLQKSSKNKEDHICKIVKKCREHEKFLSEKLKKYQNKKKASLREAWKKAEKYKNEAEQQYVSKQVSKDKSLPRVNNGQSLAQSQILITQQGGSEKIDTQKQYLSINYGSPNISKIYGNASKDYWGQLNQSLKQLKVPEQMHFLTDLEQKLDAKQKSKTGEKLKQTLTRFKQKTEQHQQAKIQLLGQRLQKIEMSRIRKIEMIKKKRQSHQTIDDQSQVEKMQKKHKVDRSQRIHSETMMRQKRVHDWSMANKHKRQQVFQVQLQSGTDYLQSQKIKYLKASLTKKITVTAIEKKLYFQRLNH